MTEKTVRRHDNHRCVPRGNVVTRGEFLGNAHPSKQSNVPTDTFVPVYNAAK